MEFIFPQGYELVSSIYHISATENFPENVTAQIQHCAELHNNKHEISFFRAQHQQSKFEELPGGKFDSHCGVIKLTQFSLLGIFYRPRTIRLHGMVCYHHRKATFVVVKDLPEHKTVSVSQLLLPLQQHSLC